MPEGKQKPISNCPRASSYTSTMLVSILLAQFPLSAEIDIALFFLTIFTKWVEAVLLPS